MARYFDRQTFAQLPSGNAGGAIAATMLQSDGGLSPFEVGNDRAGGYSLHPTGGRSTLPCRLRDNGGAVVRSARSSNEDLFSFMGDCDGGVALFVSTHNTAIRSPSIEAGQVVFDVGDGTSAVVAVMRASGSKSELEVTRFGIDAGVLMTRRFQFDPVVSVRAITVDDFDQPVMVIMGSSTPQLTDSASGAVAGLTTSSTLSLLHLDQDLNPVRFAAVDYPVPLSGRSVLAVGNVLVIDVECSAYDGGTAWPCPSDKSSFAMSLVQPDGGNP